MRQTAPDPEVLADLVSKLRYKPGWLFYLNDIDRGQGSAGLTLDITTLTGRRTLTLSFGFGYDLSEASPKLETIPFSSAYTIRACKDCRADFIRLLRSWCAGDSYKEAEDVQTGEYL